MRNHKGLLAIAAFFMVWMTCVVTPVSALEPTLEQVAKTGKIRIGYGVSAPFSFTTPDGQVVGYSIDLCRLVVAKLSEKLKIPPLEIEYVFRTPSNRVQLLNEGKIDIECNSSTNTAERRRSAAFALSHFYSATRYVSLKKHQLRTLADLKGRSVSVALGTVNIGQITEINRAQKLNISVVPVDSLQAAFDMVSDGRVSAFAMDEVLLKMMIAESEDPSRYSLSEEKVTETQPLGFMMRLDDEDFVSTVNEALRTIYKSPEMAEIYARWFERHIDPINVSLDMPMSEPLKKAFENPEPVR